MGFLGEWAIDECHELVPKVALAGEYHHHPVLIGGSD
jgi:hypothetical protein